MFLVSVLGKKYTNPSSDIIEVLAGLDSVDTVFGEFVGALDGIVRGGGSHGATTTTTSIEVRRKAVEVAMAVTAGAWGTGLGSYFIQRDMFPALMKVSLGFEWSGLVPVERREMGDGRKKKRGQMLTTENNSLYKTPRRRKMLSCRSRWWDFLLITTSSSSKIRTRCG